jgi:hypothetical protein
MEERNGPIYESQCKYNRDGMWNCGMVRVRVIEKNELDGMWYYRMVREHVVEKNE